MKFEITEKPVVTVARELGFGFPHLLLDRTKYSLTSSKFFDWCTQFAEITMQNSNEVIVEYWKVKHEDWVMDFAIGCEEYGYNVTVKYSGEV